MKKYSSVIAAVVIQLVSFSCGNGNETNNKKDSAPANAQIAASVDGEDLYKANCTMCHGEDGRAGTMGAADLSESKIDHNTTTAIIKSGKNSMRAFAGELNDAQIDAIATYIEKLRK